MITKIVVQKSTDRTFLARDGWTPVPAEAQGFKFVSGALDHVLENKLRDVQIVFKCTDSAEEMALPVKPRKPTSNGFVPSAVKASDVWSARA